MNTPPDNEAREARELLKRFVRRFDEGTIDNDVVAARAYLARYPEPKHPAQVEFEEWWKKVEDDLPAALVNRQLSGLNRHQSERLALAFYRKGLEAAARLSWQGETRDAVRATILNVAKEVPQ